MTRAHPAPADTSATDDWIAARHVVLNAHKLSLLADDERARILALAWIILKAQRPTGPAAAPGDAGARPNVTSLALHKARLRIKARVAIRAQACASACATPPRRPRITVYPADPGTPGDAA